MFNLLILGTMSQNRKKVTKDLFPFILEEAIEFHLKRRVRKTAVENLVKLGMNETTASRYISSLSNMLIGKCYESTMSISATEYFLDRIFIDFGEDKLSWALYALQQHLVYYESLRDFKRKGFWKLVRKYKTRIKEQEIDNDLEQAILDNFVAEDGRQRVIQELKELKVSDPVSVTINATTYKRDNKTISQLKYLRGYRCQMCKIQIPKADGGFYIEGAHIDPKKNRGNELPNNILILCPNHHKEFDYGKPEIISRDDEHFKFKLNGEVYDISLKLE
ncbi:hypothetical protein DWW90_19960 [Parabacteroides sp. AF17-28]|jgi:hypothetical protein|nr:hypothetical protein DWW90_19960 [Parabacteroides sp. AF17-28]